MIIGTTTGDGATVAHIKPHFFDRMAERGVTLDGIIDALRSPLHITAVKTNNRNEPSKQYIGHSVTVVYNPDTNTGITNWPTGQEKLRKYCRKEGSP